MKKSNLVLFFLFLLLIQRLYAAETIKLDEFSYSEDQIALAKEVIKILEEDHFLKKKVLIQFTGSLRSLLRKARPK